MVMNEWAVIILAALVADFVLKRTTSILNVRAAKPEMPAELRGVSDPAEYGKSRSYLRAKAAFGAVTSSFNMALLLGFWAAGGFGFADRLVRGVCDGEVCRGLLFMGSLAFAQTIITLPFDAYYDFVLENRFGFNRTTARTFVADQVKGAVLAAALGAPLLAAMILFFGHAGPYAWVLCWAVMIAFSLAIGLLGPALILPMFNKFTPMAEGPLRDAIAGYAARAAYPARGIYVMDGSRRTGHSNAFVAGIGRFRRIALFDTMIAKHDIDELVAVVAHEVGHWKLGHSMKGMVFSAARTAALLFLLSLFLQSRGPAEAFGMAEPSVYAGLMIFSIILSPAFTALGAFVNFMRRRNEYAADRFASESTGNPGAMARALLKMSVHNLSNLVPHPLAVALFYTHPPDLERIRRIRP